MSREEQAAEELARIGKLLKAQAACPEPFNMTSAELAMNVLHHAQRAYSLSRPVSQPTKLIRAAGGAGFRLVVRDAYPPAGILPGDTLELRNRRPRPGELVCIRNGEGFTFDRCSDAGEFGAPGVPGLIGVVTNLYRLFPVEEGAHGPS